LNKPLPSVCFVGMQNIPVLAPEYNQHGIGGEQVQQTLISKAMVKRGYKTSMIVADYGQEDGQEWDGVVTYKAYKFNAGLPVLRFIHPRTTGLWLALKRADADVYYISCAGMQVGLVAMFAKYYGKKVIFRIASDADCSPEKLLIEFWRDKKLYEYGLKNVDHILSQSKQQSIELLKNYNRESHIAGMLVEGCKNDYDFDKRDICVLWVSNLRQLKRPDLLLKLASEIPKYFFHMIGGPVGNEESYYDKIHDQAEGIDNINFHGQIPYHDVNDYFERAKIFVNTSDTEGFPNSYLQSWVRGTPVITFIDPDGIIEKEGLGIAVSTIEEMNEAIQSLISDQSKWQKTSTRCKEFMNQYYNDDQILEPYLSAFNALAKTSNKSEY